MMFTNRKAFRHQLAPAIAIAAAAIAIAPVAHAADTHAKTGSYSAALGNTRQGTAASFGDTPWG